MSIPASVIEPALHQIVETMYFLEPEYCGYAPIPGPAVAASLAFDGPKSGEFRIAVAEDLAAQMAADFLCIGREDVGRQEMVQAIQEFANVACGATVAAWMPEDGFHFSIPDEIDPSSLHSETSHGFAIDGGAVGLAVEVVVRH